MRAGTTIVKTAQALRRDRRGNFGMMMAVVAPLLALSAGYGLNVAQMTSVRSNLLAALDSAVTSTARDLTTGVIAEKDAREMVEAFLHANGGRAFVDADRITLDSLVVDKARGTVSAEASVLLDVAFPLFGAANQQTITVQSASLYSDKKIEIAMMLDVTGSMEKKGKVDKLGDLQKAATNAVNLLLKNPDVSKPRIRIALVPYANSVNVGSSIAKQAVFVESKASERKEAPGNTDPKAASTSKRPDNCATERKGDFRYSNRGPEASMVNRDFLIDAYAKNYSTPVCPATPIVPLTGSAKSLTDAIGDFVAVGGTAGHIGVQWTWYMLSEPWKNTLPKEAAPAKQDAARVAKYAILMTDGEFNLGYDGAKDVDELYGNKAKARSMPHAKRLCKEMRDDGIEVFTIGFKLDDNDARDVMKSCASPDSSSVRHYFDTANGDELNAAFLEIARNIERLALTR